MCVGLKDKLYWRPTIPNWLWCCFKRTDGVASKFQSLCGVQGRTHSGGQQCARPPAPLRCVQCDLAEMKRRGKEESLPPSPDWKDHNQPAALSPMCGESDDET